MTADNSSALSGLMRDLSSADVHRQNLGPIHATYTPDLDHVYLLRTQTCDRIH